MTLYLRASGVPGSFLSPQSRVFRSAPHRLRMTAQVSPLAADHSGKNAMQSFGMEFFAIRPLL
jgi:hypothetical protein